MTDIPVLDVRKVFARFSSPLNFWEQLRRHGRVGNSLSRATVRTWKTRGVIPGRWTVPVQMTLQAMGEDPYTYLVGADVAVNPFE